MRLIVTYHVQAVQRKSVAVGTESMFSRTHHLFESIPHLDGPLLDAIRSLRMTLLSIVECQLMFESSVILAHRTRFALQPTPVLGTWPSNHASNSVPLLCISMLVSNMEEWVHVSASRYKFHLFSSLFSSPFSRNAVSLSHVLRLSVSLRNFISRLRQHNIRSGRSSRSRWLYYPLYRKFHRNMWCHRQDKHFFTVSERNSTSTSISSSSLISNPMAIMNSDGSNHHLKDVVLPIVLTVVGIILIAICLGTWLRRKRSRWQRQLDIDRRPMEVSLHTVRHAFLGRVFIFAFS